jgi:hypothetical protein
MVVIDRNGVPWYNYTKISYHTGNEDGNRFEKAQADSIYR